MTGIIVITFNLDVRVFILQMEAIRLFCADPFTIEVFDNSSDKEKAEGIRYHADRMLIRYTKLDCPEMDNSRSHAWACNKAVKELYDKYDNFLLLDHDCIPFKPFSVTDTLIKPVAGVKSGQGDKKYFWPGCFMFNKLIPFRFLNFYPIHKLRADTGGGTWRIIEYNLSDCIFFSERGVLNEQCKDDENYYFYMVINETFIHWLNTSNWRKVENHEKRIDSLINITQSLINDFV